MSERRAETNHDKYIDLARTDPGKLYDADYYSHGCTVDDKHAYGRHEPWLTFFGAVAGRLVRLYQPRTVADVGCAFGLLVEALCDRGVDAYGFDISPYAVSNAREDMKDRLRVHSILDNLPLKGGEKYDLVVCIEVLEHLPPENADRAVAVLCAAADRVIFSSSPDDFEEPTHFNVLPTEAWVKLFEKHGFRKPFRSRAKYIAGHAVVMRRRSGLLSFFS
jgi:2-polyprenyl-3-methyl-5-hydroxy-6-metoxy-1,4-benzoquinol methylase